MSAEEDAEVAALPLWRRFHVKATLLFVAPVLVLLAVLAVSSQLFAREAELEVLQGRIRGLVVGLSRTIDPDDVRALESSVDHGSPAHARLTSAFARVAAAEVDVESIYVLRRSPRPGYLRFAADWVRAGKPAQVGLLYAVAQADGMLLAFERPVIESRIYGDAWGRHLSGYAPLRDADGEVVGFVGVDVRAQRVEELERGALITTALAYGAALALFVLGGAFLGRSLRRALGRIISAAGAIAAGDYGVRTGLRRQDEIGVLAERVDRMAGELEERDRMRALFGRYVSEDVARRVLESSDTAPHGARERVVTALFVDLRRYSTISEGLSPQDVLALLNDYFSAMTDIVERHRGCVVELLGDAILAVFGAPEELEDHAEAAVRCALAMQERLEALNVEWERSGLAAMWKERGVDRIAARFGAHTGRVVAGSLGGDRRAKYTVLGRAVNVAIALEAMNEELGTTLLVSAEVVAALPDELASRAVSRGAHRVRSEDVEVCSLDGGR